MTYTVPTDLRPTTLSSYASSTSSVSFIFSLVSLAHLRISEKCGLFRIGKPTLTHKDVFAHSCALRINEVRRRLRGSSLTQLTNTNGEVVYAGR
jgi:hypothetical protein